MKAKELWRRARAAVLILWIGGISVGMASAQTGPSVKDDLFAGTEKFAAGASEVTEVSMDPDTLRMVGGHDADKAHGMVLNVVKTYEYPKAGMYNVADVEAIRARLNTGDWHCTVHTREAKSGESTDICYRHRTDGLVEQAIITAEPRELTFIHQIRHAGGAGDGSHLTLPEMGALPGPEMALLAPVIEARMAAMEPMIEAQVEGLGPQLQAQAQRLAEQAGARYTTGSRATDRAREAESSRRSVPNVPTPDPR